jgi:hypothetical protein
MISMLCTVLSSLFDSSDLNLSHQALTQGFAFFQSCSPLSLFGAPHSGLSPIHNWITRIFDSHNHQLLCLDSLIALAQSTWCGFDVSLSGTDRPVQVRSILTRILLQLPDRLALVYRLCSSCANSWQTTIPQMHGSHHCALVHCCKE